MKDQRKISLCVTTFNRFDFTIKCFPELLDDDRVSEIVISDDASTDDSYKQLSEYYAANKKVNIYRNATNQGCYRNKMISLSLSTNEFGAIVDSDNIIPKSYIDALYAIPYWHPRTVYSPAFAMPHFSYEHFSGQTITRRNVAEYISKSKFDCLINTMNYFVNRDEYLRVFDYALLEPFAADSIIQNYNWFMAGNSMYVVPNMVYNHVVHDQSHYKEHIGHSFPLAKQYEERLKQLQ